MLIAIHGAVGAGKSTVVKQLRKKYTEFRILDEPVDNNPYLKAFYKNPYEYATVMQKWLIDRRLIGVSSMRISRKVYLSDMSSLGAFIFTRVMYKQGYINESDNEYFENKLNTTIASNRVPNTIIYLKCNTESAIGRIRNRDRKCERNVEQSYWDMLCEVNNTFHEELYNRGINIITVDTTHLSKKQVLEECDRIIQDTIS